MDNSAPVHHGQRMEGIISELRAGRDIEAIGLWRILYGVGWKEAKDAVEAIAAAFIPGMHKPETWAKFMVFFRTHEHDCEWARYDASNEHDAMSEARDMADRQHEVFVVRVVAKSVTKREIVVAKSVRKRVIVAA